MNNAALKLARAGVFAALIFAFTFFSVRIPFSPTNGIVHAGDAVIFIACFALGWYAAPAAVIGSVLADVSLGLVYYAPATAVVKGAAACLCVLIIKNRAGTARLFAAFTAASLLIQSAYAAYDLILIAVNFNGMGDGFAPAFFALAFLFGLIQSALSVPLGIIGCKKLPRLYDGGSGG